MNNNKKIHWRPVLGLFLFLIVLPFGSWYYLKKGFNYQMSIRSQLDSLGSLPAFAYPYRNDTIIDPAYLNGNAAVLTFSKANGQNTTLALDFFDKLHQTLPEVKNVKFLGFYDDSTGNFINQVKMRFPKLEDQNQLIFINLNSNKEKSWRPAQVLGDSIPAADWDSPVALMLDSKGIIRKRINLNNQGDKELMLQQLAIITPREKEEKPSIKREKEK